jgi:hypothetical protein
MYARPAQPDTSAQGLPVGEEPVKQIRVLMITMPRLQTVVIQSALAEEPAIQVVGDMAVAHAEDSVAATDADGVILGDGETLHAAATNLLAAHSTADGYRPGRFGATGSPVRLPADG